MIRPKVRVPVWTVLVGAVALYVMRSVLRGFDFRPELPLDMFILGLLAAVLIAVGSVRADDARLDREEQQLDHDDEDEGDSR